MLGYAGGENSTRILVCVSCDKRVKKKNPLSRIYDGVSIYSTSFLYIVYIYVCVRVLSVPPSEPIIYDAERRDMSKELEAVEGANLTLVCEVHGGE